MDDAFLIKQVVSGNKSAFTFLVLRYQRPVFKFLVTFRLSQAQREDIAQETFLRVYKSLETYDESKGLAFSSWIFQIAKNLALNETAKAANRTTATASEYDISLEEHAGTNEHNQEDLLAQHQNSSLLHQAIEALPRDFKQALILSCIDELSIDEAAQLEKCSPGTIKSRVFRAKQILRSILLKKAEA